MPRLPALSLAAVPGRRQTTLELAQEIEKTRLFRYLCTESGRFAGALSVARTCDQ